jgi:uroporphyrinogen decarboxylase
MGFEVTLNELKELTQNKVTLVGNLPPRDVLAKTNPSGVAKETTALLDAMPDKSRVVFSCGGGMPPGVSTENVNAFIDAVRNHPASKG